MEKTKYISPTQLARILGKNRDTILYHVKQGNLPVPVKIKNESMFNVDEINKLMGVDDIFTIEFVDKQEAMGILDINKKQMAYLIRKKKLPYYKLNNTHGSATYFDKRYLEAIKDEFEIEFISSDIQIKHSSMKKIVKLLMGFDMSPLLPDRQIRVLKLYYLNDMTLREISVVLGVSGEWVRQLRHTAMKKLSKSLPRLKNVLVDNARLVEYNDKLERENKILTDLLSDEVLSKFPEKELLSLGIQDCGIPERAVNAFKHSDILTVADLIGLTRVQALKFRQLGEKTVKQVEAFLHYNGLKFK